MEENVINYSNESEKEAINALLDVLGGMSESEDYLGSSSEDGVGIDSDFQEAETSVKKDISEDENVDFSDIF